MLTADVGAGHRARTLGETQRTTGLLPEDRQGDAVERDPPSPVETLHPHFRRSLRCENAEHAANRAQLFSEQALRREPTRMQGFSKLDYAGQRK